MSPVGKRYTELKTMGLIVNPAAGKDIRRLVAYGSVFGNREKINYTIRILLGLDSVVSDPVRVYFMLDPYELVDTVIDEIRHSLKHLSFEKAAMTVFGDEMDTVHYTEMAVRRGGISSLVVLGGDGTNRIVARNSGLIPLFPVSAGTNNVFADNIEPTILGMAVGFFIQGVISSREVLERRKVLRIYRDGQEKDIALIDAVLLEKKEIGARAVWDTSLVRLVVVAQTDALKTGLSSIVERIVRVSSDDSRGAFVRPGKEGKRISAPIAPGLIQELFVSDWGFISPQGSIDIEPTEGVIA
ncbi:MAG: hypothetical protein WCP87_04775, partial [Atribacterota bacterium]